MTSLYRNKYINHTFQKISNNCCYQLLQVTSNSEGVIFLDPIKSVEKEAKVLTEQGIDVIIVLSHCGLEVDK